MINWIDKVNTLFLLYSPLNQGLKPGDERGEMSIIKVFTLQSIKSRIETILARRTVN